MDFELLGPIRDIQAIAVGRAIDGLGRLRRRYGTGRWRKLKGIARVRLIDGTIHTAEVHWYEAHGIGRKELKIKFPLLD
jgi:KaiC/GvpD/RAD55 family RecA-like ATPase